jgi:predicted dehydrogenase
MPPLRLGVVGVGHLGRRHAEIYARLPGARLEAVVDLDPARARAVARELGCEALPDAAALAGRVDAASVAVPTTDHYAVGMELLAAGLPLLIEKPLAKTIEQAEVLARTARERGLILQVGHVERFNPAVAAIQGVIERPRFIECHRLGPFSFRSADIDVVLDLMIHDIDIVLHLVKAELRRVDAVGVSLLFGSEDIANARLEFDSGAVANVTASRISDKAMRKIRIFAEDTYVSLDTLSRTARIYRKSPALAEALARMGPAGPTPEALASLPRDFYRIETLSYADVQPLEEELASFVACVRERREPAVPGEHGVRAMRVARRVLEELQGHTWR